MSDCRLDNEPHTLLELLQAQARKDPNGCAFTFLWDDAGQTSLSFSALDQQARRIAATLQAATRPGARVLLVYPAGPDFIPAFFGCVYAGVLPVPATYPKPRRPMPRLLAIAEDCDAAAALTTSQTLATLDLARAAPRLQSLPWIATDTLAETAAENWRCPQLAADDLAFLQYTSGSTSEPKGVMVSHSNLMHNLEMIRQGFDIPRICAEETSNTGVSWLPAYHDMGLIGGILESLYVGGRTVLMSPASFLQRPFRWLKAISDFQAVCSGGPNFAYELCVRKTTAEQRASLELSSWQVAFCGAEPIRAETLAEFAEAFGPCGFRADAFYPCYGLAEATLLASGGHGPAKPALVHVRRAALAQHRVEKAPPGDDQAQPLVVCGQPLLDQQIAVVDPVELTPCPADRVGEIWIKGPNVAQGYWNRPPENAETFGARLAPGGDGPYLRTGDLGFLNDGKLCVTGRVKDVIIIRGRNHYPQDIERTVESAHPILQAGGGAAFSIEVDGRERLVAIHEVERQHRKADMREIIRSIRRNVAVEHELDLHAVVLIRQAALPRTTSGKVQRNLCRELYLAGELKALAQWGSANGAAKAASVGGNGATPGGSGVPRFQSPPPLVLPGRPLHPEEIERLAEQIESWMVQWLVQRGGVAAGEIGRQRPFAEFGLDSLTAVELSQELEDWLRIELTPVIAWNYPTLATLSRYLAGQLGGGNGKAAPSEAAAVAAEPPRAPAAHDFERLLAEIETLSDEEAETALNRHATGQ